MTDGLIDFVSPAPVTGSLAVTWNHGVPARSREHVPPIQVHDYDEHTVILRQSKTLSYEAPFLFLLFGNDRALLLDTGATADPVRFPLRETVDRLIAAWLGQHPRQGYELVVAHTHGHGDHVAADPQFADRPGTTVVPRDVAAVRSFFGFGEVWPDQAVPFDLGGRVLDVLGSPGHHQAAITIYDPWTGILLTGDTVLPGRLYVPDSAAFAATLDRLVAFAAIRPVTHVLGCHIEMTSRPGRDYPLGATYQPDERVLQMTPADLSAVRETVARADGKPGVYRAEDFILYNEPSWADQARLMVRGLTHKVRASATRGLGPYWSRRKSSTRWVATAAACGS
jgi:glyoxylase-like metal-dependent hydrolase (beta-lactamase superfamily II)